MKVIIYLLHTSEISSVCPVGAWWVVYVNEVKWMYFFGIK